MLTLPCEVAWGTQEAGGDICLEGKLRKRHRFNGSGGLAKDLREFARLPDAFGALMRVKKVRGGRHGARNGKFLNGADGRVAGRVALRGPAAFEVGFGRSRHGRFGGDVRKLGLVVVAAARGTRV